MKVFFRILSYFLIGALAWVAIFIKTNEVKDQADFVYKAKSRILGPCSVPLKYSIGQVDSRFGISPEEFQAEVKKAEIVWENATGKNLFEYDEKADFKINLIFDERQLRTLELRKLEGNLENIQSAQEGIKDSYKKLVAEYDKKVKEYDAEVSQYEKDAKEYEREVDYWNEKGGAPEDEFRELKEDLRNLKDTERALEEARKEINALVSRINKLSGEEKKIVEGYNQQIETYKSRFGEAREFDQGLFTGESITIYQFNEKSDLELVLAHEMGHYVGIDHLNDPKSVMYYLIGEQDLENIAPTADDLQAVSDICK
ncbi:MAG: matrixin family metalloprotease [Patescibacteria group bacterium]